MPLFVFLFFLAPGVLYLHSQETGEQDNSGTNSSGIITSIEIIGLKRTKPRVARYPLEQFLGREGSTLDMNAVKAAIKSTGILEPLEVELVNKGDGLVLRLTVEEKWAIFPFPLFMASSGGIGAGLFLTDLNAFGLLDRAAVGGMYASNGWMVTAMYQQTPGRIGEPGWNGAFSYSRRDSANTDRKGILHRRYTTDQIRFSLGLNVPFTDHFSSNGYLWFSAVSLKENRNTLNPPGNGAMILGINRSIFLHYSRWDGYLLSRQNLSLGYTRNISILGSSFHQIDFRGVYEQSLVPGFRLTLRSGAIWKSEADPGSAPLYEEGPQRALVDILPGSFSARCYAGFSGGLEKYLFKIRWGTLSVVGAWQCVFSYGLISGCEFDNGPSGGLRFYLSHLALPALGGGIAYNINSGLYQLTLNMGMDF